MKKILSLLLVIAMMVTLAVTVSAEENETATITVEMADSYGDGWADAKILALSVPSFSDMEDEEYILGEFTLEDGENGASGTQTLTIGKDQTVYFFWRFDDEGEYNEYNYEASFTIKRNGVTIYTHADETEACPLANGQLLVVSEPFDLKFTTVTYSVAPTYTVTIPASVTLGEDATISAENVVVPKGKQVEVSIAEANGFKATTLEGAEITYTVKNGEDAVAEGETVLAVNPTDGKTGSTTLSFVAPETIQYAGTYTGTVTFTVAVKDVPIINFTLDTSYIGQYISGLTTNLQAEAGMTWAQWVESDYNVDGYVIAQLRGYSADIVGVPDVDWAITDGGYYVVCTAEIIANHTYAFNITAG